MAKSDESMDNELMQLERLVAAFETLTKEEADRALWYLRDRYVDRRRPEATTKR